MSLVLAVFLFEAEAPTGSAASSGQPSPAAISAMAPADTFDSLPELTVLPQTELMGNMAPGLGGINPFSYYESGDASFPHDAADVGMNSTQW